MSRESKDAVHLMNMKVEAKHWVVQAALLFKKYTLKPDAIYSE